MHYDYIIVGQGLAGTVLSYTLQKAGKSVLVIDNNPEYSSSKVAAGIFNPITGRRMVKSWMADVLFAYLHDFYLEMEGYLGKKIFYPQHIYREFSSIEEQNFVIAKSGSEGMEGFMQIINKNKFGGFDTLKGGRVNIHLMLSGYQNKLKESGDISFLDFNFNDLCMFEGGVKWNNISAKKIIFCEGYLIKNNPFWNHLPFVATQGEILIVRIPNMATNKIIVKSGFLLSIGNDLFKVGATYNWELKEPHTTDEGKEKLVQILENITDNPYEIIEHQAGVRPTTKDRKPFIGLHPNYSQVGVFNGLGTKGVSLAPYFTNTFLQYLENNQPLPKEVSVDRFQ